MTCRIPKRLKQEPLIETVWQVQFETEHRQAVGDALPGILFSVLRPQQPDLRIHRLPLADIPAPVVAQDPNLRFAAKYRIESATWPYRFHVGDRIITINCGRPYTGWGSFKTKILDLVGILEASGLIPEPRRHSLRYIDLLNSDTMPGLASLQVGLNIGEHQIQSQPLQLRVELPDKDCAHVLQVAATAQVKLPDEEEQQGTLIDLDTWADLPNQRWDQVRDGLATLHSASKALFFCQLLSEQAIEELGPEYEENAA